MKMPLLVSIIFVSTILSSCSSTHTLTDDDYSKNAYLKSSSEVASILQTTDQTNTITLLDVRTPAEFRSSCLTGAKNIDVNSTTFEEQLSTLPKEVPYLVYCRTGHRSATAVEKMKSLGFTKVMELQGGINDWTSKGQSTTTQCTD